MDNRPWQRHYDYNVPLTIRYPRVPAHYFFKHRSRQFPKQTCNKFFRDSNNLLGPQTAGFANGQCPGRDGG